MQNKSDKSLFGIDINEYSQGVDFKVQLPLKPKK